MCVCATHIEAMGLELFMTQFPHLHVGDITKTNIWSRED